MTGGMEEARKTYTVTHGDEIMKKDFQRLRQHNLDTMRRELYRLKNEYQERFDFWLTKAGEYTTATKVAWAKFTQYAIQYKELNFKMKHIEKQVSK